MNAANTTLPFTCPDTDQPCIATVDDLGRLTVESTASPDDASKKTDAWLKRFNGKKGYKAVASTHQIRALLREKGVDI